MIKATRCFHLFNSKMHLCFHFYTLILAFIEGEWHISHVIVVNNIVAGIQSSKQLPLNQILLLWSELLLIPLNSYWALATVHIGQPLPFVASS